MSTLTMPRTRSLGVRLAVASAALSVVAGCSSGTDTATDNSNPATATGTITVFAAASLKTTFEQLGDEFEAAHPGVTVTFSFGGSADLVAQLQQGAPADLFASADTANMEKIGDMATAPTNFATNTLEIAVPPGNPAGITTLADLAKPEFKTVICAPEVPCGAAAVKVADSAGLTLAPVSMEQSVTDVLGKVQSGEADAGLVYVTDVKAAGDSVEGITFPESAAAVNTYPITTLKDSTNVTVAGQFLDFVTGPEGQKVLADAGFGAP